MISKDIRVFGHEYAPEFFNNTGVRGWWLRFLNRIRLSLELRCQFHAMLILGKKQGIDTDHLAKQIKNPNVVKWLLNSKEYKEAQPEAVIHNTVSTVEETNKSLARLMATGRAAKYRRSRHTHPIYEAEAYPNGSERPEGHADTKDRTH